MSNLFQITGEYEELLNMLYDPEIDEQVIFDSIEGIEEEFELKADNYAKMSKALQKDVDAIDEEIKRLQARKQSLESRKKRLIDNLEKAMRFIGKTKFKTTLFSFGIQKNGGKQPLTVSADINQVPEEFLIPQPPVADKDKIREYLKNHNVTWARLEPRGGSLRIR